MVSLRIIVAFVLLALVDLVVDFLPEAAVLLLPPVSNAISNHTRLKMLAKTNFLFIIVFLAQQMPTLRYGL
jgi:hypothetical protein